MAGLEDPVGVEIDNAAVDTRAANGFHTVCQAVEHLDPRDFTDAKGLIASPPCPDFSAAGKGAGVDGETGWLTELMPEWVEAIRPRWVAMEQVPAVLPIWKMHAARYRDLGYSTWCGVLNSADYGVPQTRKRAILLAHRDRAVAPPDATHAKHPDQGTMFGPLLPWVSMADALGWGMTERPSLTLLTRDSGGGSPGSLLDGGSGSRRTLVRERDRGAWAIRTRGDRQTPGGNEFTADGPSWALTEKARSWELQPGSWADGRGGNRRTYTPDEQAPTLHFGNVSAAWCWTRPATTVAADPRITAPFHHEHGEQGANPTAAQDVAEGADPGRGPIKLTVAEAATLQSFPHDYQWRGSRTAQFRQIGNAVAVRLATAILGELNGVDWKEALRNEYGY